MSPPQVYLPKYSWRSRGRPSLLLVPPTLLLGVVAGCTANVSSISPTTVAEAGPAFKLTVLGTGFSSGDSVQWNGTNRSTTYVSATELVAQINAADIATTGSASITVLSPSTSSSTSTPASNAKTVTIVAPSTDATAYQIDPAHDGAMTFNSVSFPSAASWQASLGSGAPSNIVIAGGDVFLTTGTSGGSQLFAFGQATGATAWGPKAIAGDPSGSAGVAYDNGKVFVAETASSGSTLYAYDASSGALDWSTALGVGSLGAPTAADGYVYVIGSGNATLYALDETNGTISWQQPVSAAGGTPAVTADGVYVTAATSGCSTIDFRPATGEVIWNTAGTTGSCPLAPAGTPTVANQIVYSPAAAGASGFDAETGAGSGTLADSPPAAFTTDTAYFPVSPNLDAVNLADGTVQWTFNGDNQLDTPPLVVDGQYVVTGSALGHLYAVDATSGSSDWTQSLGGKVVQLAVGDSLLLVVTEAGNDSAGTLTAYTLSTSP